MTPSRKLAINTSASRLFVVSVLFVLSVVVIISGFVHVTSMQSQLFRALGGTDSLGWAIIALGVAGVLAAITLLFRTSPYPIGPVCVILGAVLGALILHFVALSLPDARIHALAFSAWFAAALGFAIFSIPDGT